MFKKLKWGAAVLASTLLAGSLGLATPALAKDAPKGSTEASYLTKVIDAPQGTNAANDTYTFHFDGDGTVAVEDGKLVADGVEQNTTGNDDNAATYPDTIKEGDVVPAIADLHLQGKQLSEANTLASEKVAQTT
ncbi:MAG: hypothetical protein J6S63_05240, partial [Atopobiaceae bacterium]|nr:hypothetical protein [Atopobiaceae bacterium]